MILYKLITEEGEVDWARLLIYSSLSGIAAASILAIINAGIKSAERPRIDLLIELILACIIYAVSYRRSVEHTTELVESAIAKIRMRLCTKIYTADLHKLEQLGISHLYEQIVQQTIIISNGSWLLNVGLQAASFVLFTMVYIAILSRVGLLSLMLFCGIAALAYQRHNRAMAVLMTAVAACQGTLRMVLSDLIGGLKEIRLRAQRGKDLQADHRLAAQSLKELSEESHMLNQENFLILTMFVFALLALVVFVLPDNVSISTRTLSALSSAVIFLYRPLGILKSLAPDLGRMMAAANRIQAIDHELDRESNDLSSITVDPWAGRFSTITIDELCFDHIDTSQHATFSLGPISLSLQAGEIIFFVGGNGSGKTTFLKLLASLYTMKSGSICVDGIPISAQNILAYRGMFAAIFTDFHLFTRLYGMTDLPEVQVNQRLDEMHLGSVTRYRNEQFTNLKLSTGQRKRLAMTVALLEDKPIYIFDEWAADQDPEFRRYFYEQLLPELRRQGKTVLAISHDDRYFHCADRVILMEDGVVRSSTIHCEPVGIKTAPSPT